MALNDTSMHPTGVEAVYPGVMNPTESSMPKASDAYASSGDLSGADTKKAAPVNDSVEGAPGIIEGAELAPLGEGKVAADPGLISQATTLAKKAYEAVAGESK